MNEGVRRQHLASGFDGFVDLVWCSSTRCVLEADRIKRNVSVKDLLQSRLVEFCIVSATASRRQLHQRHANLVFQSGISDALAAVDQVIDIVERVKVADRCHAVFLKQVSMKLDDITGLRVQPNDIDAPRKRLQIGIRTGRFAKGIHHVERVFVAIEIQRLKTSTATGLEPGDASIASCFNRWQEIFGENTCSEDGLKSIAERRTHELDAFLSH